MKTHYVYEIDYADGMKYIGARTCEGLPINDTKYMSSSKIAPKEGTKSILRAFTSRQECIDYEAKLHKQLNVAHNVMYYNQTNQTSTKFDQQGCTSESHPHIKAMADKLRGRSSSTHQYIADANKKRSQYKGDARTDAQKLGAVKVGNWNRGRKNPAKGIPGTSNNGFIPWYYITPNGDYHEMYTTTRIDFAPTIGATSRQLGHRFHYTNQHQKAGSRATAVLRGWTFGKLPKP